MNKNEVPKVIKIHLFFMTESYLSEQETEVARQIMGCPRFQSKLECHRRCCMKIKVIWLTGSRA